MTEEEEDKDATIERLRGALVDAHVAFKKILLNDMGEQTRLAASEGRKATAAAIRGARRELPGHPTHGYVRGKQNCKYCGLRAYEWRKLPHEDNSVMFCLGCETRNGELEPREDDVEACAIRSSIRNHRRTERLDFDVEN